MVKQKKYDPIRPEDRKCFGTTEFEKGSGICLYCRFYKLCKEIKPKIHHKIDR
jgi:hypothetical protein